MQLGEADVLAPKKFGPATCGSELKKLDFVALVRSQTSEKPDNDTKRDQANKPSFTQLRNQSHEVVNDLAVEKRNVRAKLAKEYLEK